MGYRGSRSSTTACDLDMFIHLPSQQMSRTYLEGEKSSAYFEEAVSVNKSCICSFLFCCVFCVRLVSFQSDRFDLFRSRKRPNIIYNYAVGQMNMLYACAAFGTVPLQFTLRTSTPFIEPFQHAISHCAVPARFHGVRLCLQYPLFHVILWQNCSSAH